MFTLIVRKNEDRFFFDFLVFLVFLKCFLIFDFLAVLAEVAAGHQQEPGVGSTLGAEAGPWAGESGHMLRQAPERQDNHHQEQGRT